MPQLRPHRIRNVGRIEDLRAKASSVQQTLTNRTCSDSSTTSSPSTDLESPSSSFPSSTLHSVATPASSFTFLSSMDKFERHSWSNTTTSPDVEHDVDAWFAQFRGVADFEANASDTCPNRNILTSLDDVPVFSANGTPQPFSSLYKQDQGATHSRQLIIFVRHFYCGACQAYLKALARGIPTHDYFSIPIPTNIIVIGCGAPDLIPHYRQFSECPFPIFADPSRTLFKRLGMISTAKIGRRRPEYMVDISPRAWAHGQLITIRDSLRDPDGIRRRDVLRGGNPLQIGGEFLFEDGRVVWCHRMRNYRDHTEISQIRRLLELDDDQD